MFTSACLPSQAQVPDAADKVDLRYSRVRTTLDRSSGELISTVTAMGANHSGSSLQAPMHLVVGIYSTEVATVTMPAALGGAGDPLYGTFYFDLADRLPAPRLPSGALVAQEMVFKRNKQIRFMYGADPRGTPVQGQPPVLDLNPLLYAVNEGSHLVFGMTGTDPEGAVVTLAGGPDLVHATLYATSGAPAAATFDFQPEAGQRGIHLFTFTARDPTGLQDTKSVQVVVTPVNQPPTVAVPATAEVDEGQLLTIPVTGDDPDGDPITITATPLPDNAVFIQTAGGITFAPDYTQAGLYNITCQASDGIALSAPQNVAVTVNDVLAGGETNELVLVVQPVENPSLLEVQRVVGTVNADTNLPPPATISSSLITGLTPAGARRGVSLDVALTGKSTGLFTTHFAEGISQASFGAGITVNRLTVTGPSDASANITVDEDAALGTRGVRVTTLDETAVAVPAFYVEEGRASLTGVLKDPETGLPIAGAVVSLEGQAVATVTAADGSFTLLDVPPGEHTLVINPPDHQLLRLPVTAVVGPVGDLGELNSPTTVFNPAAPAGATLFSIVGRGLGDIRPGRMSEQEAMDLVRDTLLLLGGHEMGLLDEYGNQLNPNLDGAGAMSVRHRGVKVYADRLVRGESVSLLDVFYDLSFSLQYESGAPPSFEAWLGAMQEVVNEAWANPSDPHSAVPIAIFNSGRSVQPDPPVLDGYTRLTRMQAFLIISGVMSAMHNHQADWFVFDWPSTGSPLAEFGLAVAKLAGDLFTGPMAYAQVTGGSTGIYTRTWDDIMVGLGTHPTNATFSATAGTNVYTLPAMEEVLSRYYVGGDTNALGEARDILKANFTDVAVIDEIFNRNPYGVSQAIDALVEISASDNAIRDRFDTFVQPQPGQPLNLWGTMDYVEGPAFNYPLQQLTPSQPSGTPYPKIIAKSLAPAAPYIYTAREKRTELEGKSGDIAIPTVELSFYPSGSDAWPDPNPGDTKFFYRLWRLDITGTTNTTYRMVAGGPVSGVSGKTFQAPKEDPNKKGQRLLFTVPLPPVGMNQYRIDCVRGSAAIIDHLSSNELQRMDAWMTGFFDEPLLASVGQLTALGRRRIHPGYAFLNDSELEISGFSNPGSVYVAGGGSGLAAYGRVDLYAEHDATTNVYVGIPSFTSNTNDDFRGSGEVFIFNPEEGTFTNLFKTGFMIPGHLGLAKDEDKPWFFAENAASEASYGGRLFRFALKGDGGALTSRVLVGSVNYYSRLNNRAHPVALQSLLMGKAADTNNGDVLYVADAADNRIKTIPVSYPFREEFAGLTNVDVVGHNVGRAWAWSTTNVTGEAEAINFSSGTDLTFNRNRTRLFMTQGPFVLSTTGGADAAETLLGGSNYFTAANGCSVCESREGEFLFVADGGVGRILAIPISNFPVSVTATTKTEFLTKHTVVSELHNPTQVRIVDGGRAMVWVDQDGLQYYRFGLHGTVTNQLGEPLPGVAVLLTVDGNETVTSTGTNGTYYFEGQGSTIKGTVKVQSPDFPYQEEVNVDYQCAVGGVTNQSGLLTPCVVITDPPHRGQRTPSAVTVAGRVLPDEVDFSSAGGTLELSNGGGARTFPLQFTGPNDFQVTNVVLVVGSNYLKARVNPIGGYAAAQSTTIRVRGETGVATEQAVGGIAEDAAGKAVPGAHLQIYVDGILVAEADADGCGYYSVAGLPLGAVTVEVEP